MNFTVGILTGLVAGGIGGYFANGNLSQNGDKKGSNSQTDEVYNKNEKLSNRNKELERQVEDLLDELRKARMKAKDNNEAQDELEDELLKYKNEAKRYRIQSDNLTRELQELKVVCESQEADIILLKEKLNKR